MNYLDRFLIAQKSLQPEARTSSCPPGVYTRTRSSGTILNHSTLPDGKEKKEPGPDAPAGWRGFDPAKIPSQALYPRSKAPIMRTCPSVRATEGVSVTSSLFWRLP